MQGNVFIIGLGLIGSSLAVCLKKAHPDLKINGWDRSEKTCRLAKEAVIVDEIPASFAKGAQTADYIFLAVPVKTAIAYLDCLENLPLQKNVLVTDTGSTKQEIMTVSATHSFDFIGGHPMAGSHKSGVTAVDPKLFENAFYIFTLPKNKKVAQRVKELEELLKGTHAKYVHLLPETHDQITGMFSHLPHIIAASLVNQGDLFDQNHPDASRLAAGGFRDMTRIASSDPVMWTDILLSNRLVILDLIQKWQSEMTQVAKWIDEADKGAIYAFFEQAKDTRDHLPVDHIGAIPAFYDLFVDVPDYPGVIAEVTTVLGRAGISLINLKILETREDIIGVLQISFKNGADLRKAKECIERQTDYHCRLI